MDVKHIPNLRDIVENSLKRYLEGYKGYGVYEVYEGFNDDYIKIWIDPEINKRKVLGLLPPDYSFEKAQVILSPGLDPIIRLDNEAKVKVNFQSLSNNGATPLIEINNIDEEKDFAYFTVIKHNDRYFYSSNFNPKYEHSENYFKIGQDYLYAAEREFREGNFRPVIECLSIAAENLAKSRLFLIPDQEIRRSTTHAVILSKVNLHSRNNKVIKKRHKDAINKVMELRDKARYEVSFTIPPYILKEILTSIQDLYYQVHNILVDLKKGNFNPR